MPAHHHGIPLSFPDWIKLVASHSVIVARGTRLAGTGAYMFAPCIYGVPMGMPGITPTVQWNTGCASK